MHQLKALAAPSKNHGMVPDNIASADRVNSDLERVAFAHHAFPPVTELRGFALALQNFGERSSRSARRVFFQAVVHLHNFQIELSAKNSCRLFRQPKKRVHADAEVRCEHDGYFLRCRFDRFPLLD